MPTFFVHMLANQPEDRIIRPVRIPAESLADSLTGGNESVLSVIFYFGQNDFCDDKRLTNHIVSVSVGDVVEFADGELWRYEMTGYQQITREQFEQYLLVPQEKRQFHRFQSKYGDPGFSAWANGRHRPVS